MGASEKELYASMSKSKTNVFEIRTKCGSSVILDEFVGETIHLYNGQKFCPILVKEDIVG